MILVIDTSTPWLITGLWHEGHVVASHREEAGREHAARLMAALDAVAAGQRENITRVVAGTGPGSYTGVRVGLSAAQGICSGMNVPLHGADSLAAAAWDQLPHDGTPVWIFSDARRGNVYAGRYAVRDGGLDIVTAPDRMSLEQFGSLRGPRAEAGVPSVAGLAVQAALALPPAARYL